MPRSATSTPLTAWWQPPVLALACALSAALAARTTVTPEGIVVLWPLNALVLAALLRAPRALWWRFLLAGAAAEWAVDWAWFSPLQILLFNAVNLGEVTLAALVLQRLDGPHVRLDQPRAVAAFGLGVLLGACGLGGAAGALVHTAVVGGTQPWPVAWQLWWLGDALGVLMLTPAALALLDVATGLAAPRRDHRRLERLALAALALLGGWWVFGHGAAYGADTPTGPLLLFVLAIWASARLGPLSVACVNLIVGGLAIAGTLQHLGPLAAADGARAALLTQVFLFAFAGCALTLGALIAETRRHSAALRLRDRAIESIGEGVVLAEIDGTERRITYVNAGFVQLTGYRADEVIGRDCRFLQGDDREQPGLQTVRSALARGEPVQALLRNYRKDGRMFLNELILAPVRDDHHQRLRAWIGVLRDVTALHEADARLHQAYDDLSRANLALEQRVAERTAELEALNRQLENLAHTDPLTGLWNRRYLLGALDRAIAAAPRHGSQLALAMIDVDHFKAINDTHGHAAGDAALRTLARSMQAALRPQDVLARFGGEEFVVLLHDSGSAEALGAAERWRTTLAAQRTLHDGREIRFTVSIGVATWHVGEPADQLVREADEQLYLAKSRGRNRVCGRMTG